MPPNKSEVVPDMMDQAARWMATFGEVWRTRDTTRVETLFTEGVRYSFDPFSPPLDLKAVVRHFRMAFAMQAEVELSMRLVSASANKATIEWWASILTNNNASYTLSATMLLCLTNDGRVDDLHEHWMRHDGRMPSPERFN